MSNEEQILTKKIKNILSEKELPIDIKSTIENIFEEYRNFYIKYMQETQSNQYILDEFEINSVDATNKINSKYKEKCEEKAEVIEIILSALSSQNNQDEEVEKSEIDVLNKCAINAKENQLYIDYITNIVINTIEQSKNKWFEILENLRTSNEKREYISTQIKLIQNSAKFKIGDLKLYLELEDKKILEQVLSEYENYREEKFENDSHKKFINQYKIIDEMKKISVSENDNIKQLENNKSKENIIE